MSGLPNRVSRASFGPTLQDVWPVTDETKAISAKTFNLTFWQLAGIGVVSARALFVLTGNGGGIAPTTLFQALAWDSEGVLPLMVWTYVGAGQYQYQFASADYPDADGNLVALETLGGAAYPQSYQPLLTFAQHTKSGTRSGLVRYAMLDAGGPVFIDLEDGETMIVVVW